MGNLLKLEPRKASLRLAGLILCLIAAFVLFEQVERLFSRSTPRLMTIWAWERSENLLFLDPKRFSVAYLAGTICLKNGFVFFEPRLGRLNVPPQTELCPVFRIESGSASECTTEAADEVVRRITTYLKAHSADRVQLDYDATLAEREFYISLLMRLRRASPAGTHIAMTALASWCLDDRWLSRADADEAIVMLFSMGPSRDDVLALLGRQELEGGGRTMRLSLGVSANERFTNEQLKLLHLFESAKHVYFFNSLPWTDEAVQDMLRQIDSSN